MVLAMMMVMGGRRRRRGSGGSGVLRFGVSGKANNKRGGSDDFLDHERNFLFLKDHRGSSSIRSLIRLN
jgi:hypothetical protein